MSFWHQFLALASVVVALVAAPQPACATGETAFERQLPGGPLVHARPGAKLRVLGKPQEIAIAAGGLKRAVYTVIVKSGSVDVMVPQGATSAVALSAPRRLTVLVRSGRVGLRATADQVSLANVDGDILVGHDARHFKALRPGVIRHFKAHGTIDDTLLEAPTELSGQRVLVSTGEPVALGKLWWRARPGAEGYRVELAREGERRPLLRVETREPVLPPQPVRLAPGSYRIEVRALDVFGFESTSKLESSLHVVTARLPRGGYVDDAGKIRIPPGSRVDFLHLEGIELSYADFAHERAPSSVGLTGSEPVALLLRSQRRDAVLLHLAPRTVRARIDISPKRAAWPADELTIRVRLEDPGGQPVPAWLKARPRVLLGIDPLVVPFERVGRELCGVVRPQPGPGPWVVRVEVEDQFGIPLGRASFEVAKTRR